MLGTAMMPVTAVTAALNRADHYDPYANRVVLYNADPAILSHELGHAKDFNTTSEPISYALARGVIPGVGLYQEGTASLHALKDMADSTDLDSADTTTTQAAVDELTRASRVLGGGMGSYIGAGVGSLVGRASPAADIVAKYLGDGSTLDHAHLKGIAKAGLMALGGIGGALAGQAVGYLARPFTTGEDRERLLAAESRLGQ